MESAVHVGIREGHHVLVPMAAVREVVVSWMKHRQIILRFIHLNSGPVSPSCVCHMYRE